MGGMKGVSADVCQDLCVNTTSCISEDHEHGSYCKSWQSPPVCFGLYFTDASQTTMCFLPNDPTCPESFPVEC